MQHVLSQYKRHILEQQEPPELQINLTINDGEKNQQLGQQKQDLIKKVFKHESQPTEQQVQYALSAIKAKYASKHGVRNVISRLYLNFLQQERKRVLLDSHCRLQPNLYKLYEPDAGSSDVYFNANRYHQKLTLDHEVKRLKATRQAISFYCEQGYHEGKFHDYLFAKKGWPNKLAKNKPAFYLTSAFRTTILRVQIFIALSLTIKITPMTRAEFDTVQPKLLVPAQGIPTDFFETFSRALKTTYGIKVKMLTQKQTIRLYRQIRELVNIQKVMADERISEVKHRQLYNKWTNEMSINLMKYFIQQPKINVVTQKMERKYPMIQHLIDQYLMTLRLEILIRAAIKWLIIMAVQSRFQNPLEFREEDRSVITRGPQLEKARFQLIRLYSKRYFYQEQPPQEKQFWRRQLYEQVFRVIEVIQQGLIKFKRRKNKVTGSMFKDLPSDAEQIIKRKMRQAQFQKYRMKQRQRYDIYKKQLRRQGQAQTKLEIEKLVQQRNNYNFDQIISIQQQQQPGHAQTQGNLSKRLVAEGDGQMQGNES